MARNDSTNLGSALYSLKDLSAAYERDRVVIDQASYLLVLKYSRYMPSKISAVMQQAGKLHILSYMAVEHKVTRSLYPFANHPFAAEQQIIHKGVRRKVRASLYA